MDQRWADGGAFLLPVGIEIKRELIVGELASVRKAALPIACAMGGMIVPAAFYWICNMSGPNARGWGIPMATDIASLLEHYALIAPNAPAGARVFLAALAIVDDMGAVLVLYRNFLFACARIKCACRGSVHCCSFDRA